MAQMNENIATAPVSPPRFFAKPISPGPALPLAGATGRAGGSSLHRYGLWIFRLRLPMSQLIEEASLQCPVTMSFWQQLFTRDCDWKISMLGWTYTLFFCFFSAVRRHCGAAVADRGW